VGIGNDEQRHPDLHELSNQVARVREKTRPWKETIALVLAIGAATVSHHAVQIFQPYVGHKAWVYAIRCAFAIVFLALGTVAVLGISAKARAVFEPRLGSAHAAVIRYALLLVGVILVVVITLQLLGVPVGQLVVGTAVTSVLLGIAAQQSLSNIFAGMVLLLSRPFRVGDPIRLRAGALGGQLEGVVTEIGITYIRLDIGDTIMSVPNSQVLAAAVGPIPREPAPPAAPTVPEPENPVTRPPGAGARVLTRGATPRNPPRRCAGPGGAPPGTPRDAPVVALADNTAAHRA
jgi:small-conductance mechanosensitive channel